MKRLWRHLNRAALLLKRTAGMPDYDAYVAHMQAQHPEGSLASEAEFYRMYLQGRYEGVGTRCC